MASSPVIRVLVVDDSSAVRRIVTQVLELAEGIEVVGTANDGQQALAAVAQLAPDVVTLDIEMPVLDGLSALRELRRTSPRLPVIMFSTLTERGGAKTLEALALGASDYVTKPSKVMDISAAMASVHDQLVPKLRALCGPRSVVPLARAPHDPGSSQLASPSPTGIAPPPSTGGPRGVHVAAADHPDRPARAVRRPTVSPEPGTARGLLAAARAARPRRGALLVGSSTGGPEAVAALLGALPATFPVPIVVVQHMPSLFTRLFAERLDRLCALTVREAAGGEPLTPGQVLIAPGGQHLEVVRQIGTDTNISTRLSSAPPVNYCRPSVDVLFRSAVEAFGGDTVAVVLTGMGHDGRDGCAALQSGGARVIVQDEATSVVWGMPGAVVNAGLADEVLPLADIAGSVMQLMRARISRPSAGSRS